MKFKFREKYRRLTLNHPGDKAYPFPGKNKVRWAIVDLGLPKYPCIYEGKPSIQAIEIANKRPKTNLHLMEFDRGGIFFVQTIERGNWHPYSYVAINPIFYGYHGVQPPDKYLNGFRCYVREAANRGIR